MVSANLNVSIGIDLDLEDVQILLREYEKREEELNADLHRLETLNMRIAPIISDAGRDFVKENKYVDQDKLIKDTKVIDEKIKAIRDKRGYFMEMLRKDFFNKKGNPGSIRGELKMKRYTFLHFWDGSFYEA